MATTYTFSPVTSTDRAGVVWVAAILSLMFTIITLATRFQIKFHSLGLDDWFIACGTIAALGQYIAIYVALSEGVGKSSTLLTRPYAVHLGRSVLASEILFLVAVCLSKISVVFFMKRLFTRDHKWAWWCCNAALVASVFWGVGSTLGVSVDCGPRRILYGSVRCPEKLLRWTLVISFDALLEVIYVALAVVLVWPLQMRMHIKATVVFAFAFRLICAVFAALHGVWIARYVHSSDPGLAIADVLVWQQVALGYSLIATTVPTLKNFVRGYNQAMGWEASSAEKRGFGGGYNLGPLARSTGNRSRPSQGGSGSRGSRVHSDDQLQLGPSVGDYRVGAFHDASKGKGARRPSGASGESADPIIRRQISVTVEHEQASLPGSSAV